MYKTFIFLLCSVLIWSCDSKKTAKKKVDIAVLQLDNFTPKTVFDRCLNLETYQLLAAASQHLEQFISNELLSEGEDLAVGYQRFVEEWTGQSLSEMNTEKLLNDNIANALLNHPNFKNIWIPLVELGDTTYTEELAYDEDGNEVIVKYIENYYTLNSKSDYYNCIKQNKNGFIQTYLINKEYGNVEPQDFAMELSETLEYDQYNDYMIRQLIMIELYLRIIAIKNQ
ncbi:MAG: hypothetical protein AB8G11_22625 [Saprospiraceae bacterium]